MNSEALDNNAYKLKFYISTPAEGSELYWILTAIDCFYPKSLKDDLLKIS